MLTNGFISEQDIEKVKEDLEDGVINDQTVHYNLLLRSKIMDEISNQKQYSNLSLTFRKRDLRPNIAKSIKNTGKKAKKFSKNINHSFEDNKRNNKIKSKNQLSAKCSITNSTLSSNSEGAIISPKNCSFGLIYKRRFEDLFGITFKLLKDMNIVWKSTSSDYLFKCKSTTPTTDFTHDSKINEDLEDSIKSGCIKFYLQFSKISSQDKFKSFEEKRSILSEYCISFIWNGNSVYNFLDFISVFKTSLDEHM